MKLNQAQRAFLLLGMVLAIAFLPLVGGLHHHDHDEATGEMCWFCTTANAALAPLAVALVTLALGWAPFLVAEWSLPSRFPWTARYRRGPPSVSQA